MIRFAILILATAGLLFLSGCPSVRLPDAPAPTVKDKIKDAEKHDADRKAPTTSDEAKEMIAAKDREIAAAKAVIAQDEADKAELRTEVERLHEREVAQRIGIASWWTFGVGVACAIVGIFLSIRFPGKTSIAILLGGCGVAALGLLGVWMAPHWMLVAWIAGGGLAMTVAAYALYLLHGHQVGMRRVWDLSEDEIKADPRLMALLKRAGAKV